MRNRDFNTSHVTVYPQADGKKEQCQVDFNTSHVTVYLSPPRIEARKRKISIHLMLRFISAHMFLYACASSFQYISCYGLSWYLEQFPRYKDISIHLMLRFIFVFCILATVSAYFNTSHVTVYRNIILHHSNQILFQYISCYGLS